MTEAKTQQKSRSPYPNTNELSTTLYSLPLTSKLLLFPSSIIASKSNSSPSSHEHSFHTPDPTIPEPSLIYVNHPSSASSNWPQNPWFPYLRGLINSIINLLEIKTENNLGPSHLFRPSTYINTAVVMFTFSSDSYFITPSCGQLKPQNYVQSQNLWLGMFK